MSRYVIHTGLRRGVHILNFLLMGLKLDTALVTEIWKAFPICVRGAALLLPRKGRFLPNTWKVSSGFVHIKVSEKWLRASFRPSVAASRMETRTKNGKVSESQHQF